MKGLKKIEKILIGIAFGFFLSMALFGFVSAQNDTFGLTQINETIKLGGGDIREIAARIINIALGLLGIITVGLVLYGGFLYMTAGGNDDQIGTAKKYIINAAIGLAIILSAFAIVQFVFKSLQDAIVGGGDGTGEGGGIGFGQVDCLVHPEYDICKSLNFYVQSITPGNSAGSENEKTEMNNVKIRVLFSRSLAPNADVSKAITLIYENQSDPLPLLISLTENNRVLEAVFSVKNKASSLKFNERYKVTVSSDIKDGTGMSLNPNYTTGGVQYPATVYFFANANFQDTVKPVISNLTLNGAGGKNLIFSLGQNLSVAGVLNDRAVNPFGGNGLVKISIAEVNGNTLVTGYSAPLVTKGSINPFAFSYTTKLTGQYITGKKYSVTITGHDIDNNVATASIQFGIKAAHCGNGVKDGDETGVDSGGACGGGAGDSCEETSDCASGFVCLKNICTAMPVIEAVDPMNGASGNWISILGKHFGNKTGKIEFASDHNNNGVYDANEWVKADVIACSGVPSWNPDWVVAKVPSGSVTKNTAVQFSTINSYVEVPGEAFQFGNALTFEAWVKPTEKNGYRTILAKSDAKLKEGYFFALNNLQPAVWFSGLKTPGWHLATGKVDLNVWSHIAVTYDGANIQFYINGKLDKSSNYPGVLMDIPNKKLWIGMREDKPDPTNQYAGFLDEIALYKKVLSYDQITAHYTESKNSEGDYSDLIVKDGAIGYWRLGEFESDIAVDEIQNQNNGKYVGSVVLNKDGIFGATETKIGIGQKSAIRVVVDGVTEGNIVELIDSTVDDFGPKPAGDGLFVKNTIKRPGLCRVGVTNDTDIELGGVKVTLLADSESAPPKIPVTVVGSGFGVFNNANKIVFGAQKNPETGVLTGGFQAEVKSFADWDESSVNTKVPDNLQPGSFSVHLSAAGETSNGVKFTVLSGKNAAAIPKIDSIDPATTTPKSFITVSGSGFGNAIGQIFAADSEDHTQTCGTAAAHSSCLSINVDTLPAQCGSTWRDTQVIAEIPQTLAPGTYFISLKNNLNFRTDGKNIIGIFSGAPRAGICGVEPEKGPAPLPANSEGIKIFGVHFGVASILYFWQPGAETDKPNTWLHSDIDTLNGTPVIKTPIYANQITTLFPVGSKGTSMSTGPIKIKNLDGSFTNSINYTVESCVGVKENPGYHCCAKGPEIGMWKQNNQACSGEAREAGYVWRFSTGVIADLPRVIEECNATSFPSPTPRKKETGSKTDACVNSTVALRFNMGMNSGTLNENTIKVFTCGTSTATSTLGAIDCAKQKTPVNPLSMDYQTGANTLIIRQVPPLPVMAPNTWYRVELSDTIKSQQYTTILGVDQPVSSTLSITKSCGAGTAFCFDFKTGSSECTLADAGINPPNYITRQLGIIQDQRYPPVVSAFFSYPDLPPFPYYYFIWGKGSQECSVINVDQYPWEWSPVVGGENSNKAVVYKSPLGSKYVNSRAVVDAIAHTAPQNVVIKAETSVNNIKPISDIEGIDILAAASIVPGLAGFAANEKIELSPETSDLLSLQSSFTLQFKFSQTGFFSYNVLAQKINASGPAVGYKIVNYSSEICISTYTEPAGNLGFKHCLKNPKGDVNGIYNVLLSWNKDTGKLAWIDLIAPVKQEVISITGIPVSSGVASLFAEKQPAQSQGPVLYRFFYKNESSNFNIVNGSLNFAPTSSLVIDLKDPSVTYFEPNCVESCVNATIRADFNRAMDPATYAAGFRVYKCLDGSGCATAEQVSLYAVDAETSDSLSLRTVFSTFNQLDPNTYYKVSLNGDATQGAIKSVAQVSPTIVWGKALPKTEWIFKTKSDGKPCSVGSLKVTPVDLLAIKVGQQDKFTVTPYSAPNVCSKIGQALNKWAYEYTWGSQNENVAKISAIKPALYANISSSCTVACVKKGSSFATSSAFGLDSLCGNGKVETGEDCDLGIAGEAAGVSCSLNCLRPGNNIVYSVSKNKTGDNLCGNEIIEKTVGELCDPGKTATGEVITDNPYCTATCLLRGSSSESSGKVDVAVCGDGEVKSGQETCDTKDVTTQKFCSEKCLHKGTVLAEAWCQGKTQYQSNPSCIASVSVCGNGIVEPSEDCDPSVSGIDPKVCTNQCVYDDACGLPNPPCQKGIPGCTDKCTLTGSKSSYPIPSVCGDGAVGLGENPACELTLATDAIKAGPTQLVTAVGTGSVVQNTNYQQTKIFASTNVGTKTVTGESDYKLQCGYTEYVIPTSDNVFNDCPGNTENTLGVGSQSCCMPRPKIKTTYPADGDGFFTPGVCRNTFIEVTFDQQLRPETISSNMFLVRGHTEPGFTCATSTQDVTHFVNYIILNSAGDGKPVGFWATLWNKIKNVFKFITGGEANATVMKGKFGGIQAWCANEIPIAIKSKTVLVNDVPVTSVTASIGSLLEPNAIYGILTRGEVGGMVNLNGVPLRAKDGPVRNDAFFFLTGAKVCKINSLSVSPKTELFSKPNTAKTFSVVAKTDTDQLIVPTPNYNWEWSWEPKYNPVFSIPYPDTPTNTDTISIGSKNVQGRITGIAKAKVTADTTGENKQLGKTFTGIFNMTALFCERPWPAPDAYPYSDGVYNYEMSYCADSGETGVIADDLPYLKPELNLSGVPGSSDILKKIVFFNDKNKDVIGVQIFSTPQKLDEPSDMTIEDWYAKKFGAQSGMKSTSVAGYSALTDGNNYYVMALNYVPSQVPGNDQVFSNVYLFSVNAGADSKTQEVLKRLLNSLQFNINVTDHGYCLSESATGVRTTPDDISSIQCSTDFDCRDDFGVSKLETIGVCSNARTKFHRDWKRLHDIRTAQDHIDGYFSEHIGDFDFKGNLASGSFVPGYTVSQWGKSWGLLQGLVGGLPTDPISKWTACAADDKQTCWDATKTTYFCPAFSSMYEYEYVNSTQSYLFHAPLEFFTVNDDEAKKFIDTDTFTAARWKGCNSGAYNPFSEQCGDGVLNAAEECDPPGKVEITNFEIVNSGECSNWFTKPACISDSFCGYSFTVPFFSETSDYRFHMDTLKANTGFCTITPPGGQKYIITRSLPGPSGHNDYVLFTCEEDVYCRDWANYSHHDDEIAMFEIDTEISATKKFKTMSKSDYYGNFHEPYLGHTECTVIQRDDVILPEKCVGIGLDEEKVCSIGKTASRSCSKSCGWEYGQCVSSNKCGNGIVESSEVCDDGGLNGTYGHCHKECSGKFAAYCGNGILDYNDSNENGTKEANEKNYEFCEPGVGGFSALYNAKKEKSCSWDCQGNGGYCGDGFLNADRGEECDDGNIKTGDLCSPSCKFTAKACKEDVFGLVVSNDPDGHNYQTEVVVKQSGEMPPSCAGSEITVSGLCDAYYARCKYFMNKLVGFIISANCDGTPEEIAEANTVPLASLALSNGSGASVFCKGNLGSVDETAVAGSCGNGIIDATQGEICDAGDKNDTPCVPGAGEKICTYCSNNCTKILTVDNSGYCGNGKIDSDLNEQCDFLSDGTVLGSLAGNPLSTEPKVCPDKGTYLCLNACTYLKSDGCVSCGKKDIGGAFAGFTLINPLLWSWSEASQDFQDSFDLSLSKKSGSSQSFFGKFWFKSISSSDKSASLSRVFSKELTYSFAANLNLLKLESSPLCSADYEVMFNSYTVNNAGTLFPYPVIGESQTVNQEIIMSPAVPPQTFRVVLKWTSDEAGAEFNGNVFNEDYTNEDDTGGKESDVVRYSDRATSGGKFLCSSMKLFNEYWIPFGRLAPITWNGAVFGQNCSAADGVSIGPKISSQKTHIQTFTIKTNYDNYTKPFAFFVNAIDKPISSYKNSNLEVQVYTYETGQKPQYSIYGPKKTYTIKKASDMSTSPIVKYWHVFNLVKDGSEYTIKPVDIMEANGDITGQYTDGMLQSNFCSTLNHIPGSVCSET